MMHWKQNQLRVRPVHPSPSKRVIGDLQSTEDGTPTTLVINVRDPVDRFISAFQWRLVRLCAADDEREQGRRGGAQKADEICLSSEKYKKEASILRETYRSNPNVLAEALCEHSETHPRALEDIANIGHSLRLAEWLDFLISKNDYDATTVGVADFMALPLEKQSGAKEALFEQHIDQLALSLTHTHFGRDVARELKQKMEKKLHKSKNEKMMHSSSTYTNQTKPPPLTPLGECCLTRYFEDDYRLIQSMVLPSSLLSSNETVNDGMIIEPLKNAHPILAKACSWGNEAQQKLCRLDLQSMLLRRSKYLNLSSGSSCAKIVSNSW